jgi:hypothetical protein
MNETVFTETDTTPKPSVIKYKPRYICKSKVKQLALQTAHSQLSTVRQKMFTRVGTSFYEACDACLANFIASRVRSHPSKGKTLT